MKKILICAAMLFISVMFCFCLSTDIHLGLLSGIGFSFDIEKIKMGIDLESSFPVYAIGNGYMCQKEENCNFKDGFTTGLSYFAGLDTYFYYSVLNKEDFYVYAGLDLFSGAEIPLKCFDMVLKGGLRFEKSVNDKQSIYVVVNYPVAILTFTDGFKTPLIRFCNKEWLSVLTGCKIGLSFKL